MPSAARERLSFDDAQILRLESAAIKGHTGKLLVLAPDGGGQGLDAAHLREQVADRIEGFPRLRQRVEIPRRGLPAWVDDPDLDLDWHVAASGDADPIDDVAFRALAGEILAERLDHERPLWRLDVVALAGGRTGIVGRIHHAMADGVSAIRIAGGLLWEQSGPDAPPATPRRPAKSAAAPEHQGEESDRRSFLSRLPGIFRRELRPGRDTVLDKHIGPEREVAWTVFPLGRLKAAGKRAGNHVTVNDTVLGVVAGALRCWLEGVGGRPEDLRAQVPVCLHLRDGDASVGNRDSFLNVDLPISVSDPLERLRLINAETRERKLDHDADALYAFFHALGRFRPLYRGVTRVISGPREFALSVSNVPGPPERPSILGHEVHEFISFAEPADRHALRVAVISLGGDLAFGLCSDPAAIGQLDRLGDCLEESLVELEREA